MDRAKILMFSGIGILVLLLVFFSMRSCDSSGSNEYEDNFLGDSDNSFTYEDMMEQENNQNMFDVEEKNEGTEKLSLNGNSSFDNIVGEESNSDLDYFSNEEAEIIKQIEEELGNKQSGGSSNTSTTDFNKYLPNREEHKRPTTSSVQVTEEAQVVSQPTKRTRININDLTNENGSSVKVSSSKIAIKTYENKKVIDGSYLKLITTKEHNFKGTIIPSNTILTGIVSIGSDKMNIIVNTIKLRTQTLSCNLSAYGDNGMEGMVINNDGIKKDAVNEATGETGTYIQTPIGRIGTNAFKKNLNDNSVQIYDNIPLTLR